MKKQPQTVIHVLDIACHEAGHAVVATHLGVVFKNVCICLTPKNQMGGCVELDMFYEPAESRRVYEERIIIQNFAGKLAETLCGDLRSSPGVLDTSDSGDLEVIKRIQSHWGMTEKKLSQLRRRAERILSIPHIRFSVRDVAFALFGTYKNGEAELSAEQVKKIYRANARLQ
jgi:hypothetical protein